MAAPCQIGRDRKAGELTLRGCARAALAFDQELYHCLGKALVVAELAVAVEVGHKLTFTVQNSQTWCVHVMSPLGNPGRCGPGSPGSRWRPVFLPIARMSAQLALGYLRFQLGPPKRRWVRVR